MTTPVIEPMGFLTLPPAVTEATIDGANARFLGGGETPRPGQVPTGRRGWPTILDPKSAISPESG
jgi:hypothetical protein